MSSVLPLSEVSKKEGRTMAWRRWLPGLLWFALLLALQALPTFYVSLLNQIGLGALATLGLVLLTGVVGLTSFGQAAFIGVGAYTCAWLSMGVGLPVWLVPLAGSPWLALPAGLLAAALIALVLGALTLRLSGHYLPLGTICWGLALYALFGTSEALGGHSGLSGLPVLTIGSWALDQPDEMGLVIWAVLGGALLMARQLLASRTGRALRALNGGQMMAASMGVPVFALKMKVFVLSALLAALSGWLYACNQRFVSPAPFSIGAGIDIMFMALVGGLQHVWGALAGAAAIVIGRNALQDLLPHLFGEGGFIEAIVFGLLVLGLMHRAPQGVWGWVVRRWQAAPVLPARPVGGTAGDAALATRALPAAGTRVLEARKVTRRFGGLVANQDIDLALHAGEILAVIGPNGAGKSTLFNQLSCVDVPSEGEVRLNGQSMRGWTPQHCAVNGLSRTFQHVKLIGEMTVLENVVLGAHLRGRAGFAASALHLERAEEARLFAAAWRQLERVGLADLANVPAGQLALGQQRLVEVARALCADPAVLLLDEPAAGVPAGERQDILDTVAALPSDVSVVLIEHDMDLVFSFAKRMTVLVNGTVLTEGTPEQIAADPQVKAVYLGESLTGTAHAAKEAAHG